MNIEAFFKLSYGLYIVSTGHGTVSNGFIANTVFQVTAEPPQFAVCCNKNNHTAELIKNSGSYSVSILSKDASADLIGLFGYKSGKDVNKFEKTAYIRGQLGTPIVVEDCVAWFECEVVGTFDVGTHLVFLGKIINNEVIDASLEPLTYAYYREVKKGVAPKNAPTYIDKTKIAGMETVADAAPQKIMKHYECQVCGFVYDPEKGDPDSGIAPGTAFEDIPEGWVCPVCGTQKSDFTVING